MIIPSWDHTFLSDPMMQDLKWKSPWYIKPLTSSTTVSPSCSNFGCLIIGVVPHWCIWVWKYNYEQIKVTRPNKPVADANYEFFRLALLALHLFGPSDNAQHLWKKVSGILTVFVSCQWPIWAIWGKSLHFELGCSEPCIPWASDTLFWVFITPTAYATWLICPEW